MVVEEAVVEVPLRVIESLGQIALYLSAVGIIILIWLIVQVVNLIMNRKKRKALYEIRDRLDRVEKKIDRLGRKK